MAEFQQESLEPPYHFCTYFDRNYLTRGLALYESLQQTCHQPFVLWILCFDDTTFDVLGRLNLPQVRPIALQDFEANDEELLHVKSDRTQLEYFWTCTPSLPLYVFRRSPEIAAITYLDADLYFFSDLQPIFDELGDGSILISEHRYAPEHELMVTTSGIYNVGILTFRRDANGLACLHWWRERCLEWCHTYYEDGRFGDQLYLDDWPQRFNGVVILQHSGTGVAPWNLTNHEMVFSGGGARVDGKPLVFFHFHGFRSVSKRLVEPLSLMYKLSARQAAAIYLPYAHALTRAAKLAQWPIQDEFISPPSRHDLFDGALNRRYLLVSPSWLSVMLWQLGISQRDNEMRVTAGFAAYGRGDTHEARGHFLRATLRNPLLLGNLGIASILLESILGPNRMMNARAFGRRVAEAIGIARRL